MFAPGCIEQWNRGALFGLYIVGLPIEEVLWAAGFGALWPAILAFATEQLPGANQPVAGLSVQTQ